MANSVNGQSIIIENKITRSINGRAGWCVNTSPRPDHNDRRGVDMAKIINNDKIIFCEYETIFNEKLEGKIIKAAEEELRDDFFQSYYDFSRNLENIQSPIEKAFICAFFAMTYKSDTEWHSKALCLERQDNKIEDILHTINGVTKIAKNFISKMDLDKHELDYFNHVLTNQLYIYNQVWIFDWPVDFLMAKQNYKTFDYEYLIIECDGHDYHERTKEQARKDRKRDRDLQSEGYTVFRFTGSEIFSDPIACVRQVLDWAGI
jgi:very-short-patch-repair endonuclease